MNERRRARSIGLLGGLLLAASGLSARAAQVAISRVTAAAARAQASRKGGPILIDVRNSWYFEAEHIQGALNFPAPAIDSAPVPKDRPLVLYCSAKGCSLSQQAALTLKRRGYDNLAVLDGGIEAWRASGYPMAVDPVAQRRLHLGMLDKSPLGTARPDQVEDQIAKGLLFTVDSRPPSEYQGGHLPHALNIPLESVADRLCEVPTGRDVVVYDRVSSRAIEAARRLRAEHISVRVLEGGLTLWASKGYPLSSASDEPETPCAK